MTLVIVAGQVETATELARLAGSSWATTLLRPWVTASARAARERSKTPRRSSSLPAWITPTLIVNQFAPARAKRAGAMSAYEPFVRG